MMINDVPIKTLIMGMIVPLSLAVLFISIGINFLIYDRNSAAEKFKKSPVETFSMTLFSVGIYFVIINQFGSYPKGDLSRTITYMGLLVFPLSCLFNIVGRFYLGSNWSNQVRLKENHSLVCTGPYKIVRHPLYASTIWMIYAASMIYANYLTFILNTLVFIPLMAYRAKQEESFLITKFPEYSSYIATTGLFFPKLWRSNESD